MEDAHMCRLWLADKEDVGLFGVFDGHGGQEVALFCAKYLADELQKTDAFRRKEYASALEQTFRQLDRMVADRSRWPELRELAAENQEGNPAAMDESELPEYLTRVLEAARQRHKSLVAGEEEEEEEEDDDEMDDEVGDPNFNPEFQDQESDASQCGGSDDGGGGTDEDAGCEDQSGDEGSERNERTDSPGGYGHQSQPQELAPQAEAEGRDSGTDEVWEEASATPITRRDSSKSEGDLDLANMATPQYSDGFCSDDGDDYSDDEFESIEDSDDFSSAGKRLTSPLRCQRGKEGDPRFGPLRRAFPCPRCVVRDERGRARAQKASEAGRAPQKPKPSFPQRLPLEQRVSALLRPIDRFLPGFASLPILCWPPTSAFARRETLPREPSRLDRQPPKERPE